MVGRPHRDRSRRHALTRRRTLLVLATALYLSAVAWLTLRPSPYDPEAGEFLASVLALLARSPVTAWITFDVVEFAANVALFVPLGILCVLWAGARRWWIPPIAGLVLSGAIELSQALFLDTRVADVRDLAANTLGAVIGLAVMLAVGTGRRCDSSRRRSADPSGA